MKWITVCGLHFYGFLCTLCHYYFAVANSDDFEKEGQELF